MIFSLLLWFASTALICAALVALRRRALHRASRLADFHWKGMVVLALVLGALPVILLTAWHGHRVVVPESSAVDRVLQELLPATK
jgi:hypothetical protein